MGVTAPPVPSRPAERNLDEPVRGFVSWHSGGALVGCIGLVESVRPLQAFVERFAVQAGVGDKRTPDLLAEQVSRLDFELHLLSESTPLLAPEGGLARGLESIAQALIPKLDGLWLMHPSGARAFFLPAVWEQLPRSEDFVRALARKAGLDLHGRDCETCSGAVLRAWTMHDRI